jgi:hypothetical protein
MEANYCMRKTAIRQGDNGFGLQLAQNYQLNLIYERTFQQNILIVQFSETRSNVRSGARKQVGLFFTFLANLLSRLLTRTQIHEER